MNLKGNMEGYMREFGEGKGKREMHLNYELKKRRVNTKRKEFHY